MYGATSYVEWNNSTVWKRERDKEGKEEGEWEKRYANQPYDIILQFYSNLFIVGEKTKVANGLFSLQKYHTEPPNQERAIGWNYREDFKQ